MEQNMIYVTVDRLWTFVKKDKRNTLQKGDIKRGMKAIYNLPMSKEGEFGEDMCEMQEDCWTLYVDVGLDGTISDLSIVIEFWKKNDKGIKTTKLTKVAELIRDYLRYHQLAAKYCLMQRS